MVVEFAPAREAGAAAACWHRKRFRRKLLIRIFFAPPRTASSWLMMKPCVNTKEAHAPPHCARSRLFLRRRPSPQPRRAAQVCRCRRARRRLRAPDPARRSAKPPIWKPCWAPCDGIMLTGSASNVHPSHYAEDVRDPSLPQDPMRDATTLPLIRAALRRGIPILSICRGFQEMNVALGGSLHQAVQEVAGHMDHRENDDAGTGRAVRPAHPVSLSPLGVMAQNPRSRRHRSQFPARPGRQPAGARPGGRSARAGRPGRSVFRARRGRRLRWPCNGIRNGASRPTPSP